MKDDHLYLVHITECITRISQYTSEGEQVFLGDTKPQDAVLRNLQTLTESTTRLSGELKGRYPGIDWRAIAGFRNVVVHDYLGIDLREVWNIVVHDLPPLERTIEQMLRDLGADPTTASPDR